MRTTTIFEFEFLVPVQRDHVVVVTEVEDVSSQKITDVVVDQTAGVTYCSDALYRALWSDDEAFDDPIAALTRAGWRVRNEHTGRVVSVLMTSRDEGDANILRTRVLLAPMAAGGLYR